MTPSCVGAGGQSGRLRRIGVAAAHVSVQRLGQAEVQDLDDAVAGDLDVGRLQVAMDDAALVRRLERFGDLQRNRDGLVQRNTTAADPVGECLAVHELEDQDRCMPPRSAHVFDAVDGGDVWMAQCGEHARFALEARAAFSILNQRGGEDFQRDVALQAQVAGQVHFPHPADAKQPRDLESRDLSARRP